MFKFNFISDEDATKDETSAKEIVSGKFRHIFSNKHEDLTEYFQFFI